MNNKHIGAVTCAAIYISVCTASVARADGTANSGALEEIVVTAQKREEDIQNVPTTISAFGAQDLERLGISGTGDIAGAVPGVVFQTLNGQLDPYIRGVGSQQTNVTQESDVGVYIDGVYQASTSGVLQEFSDVQRVEVLKGPQTTLFGRNTTGGAINIVTRDPTSTPEANVDVSYGSWDTFQVKSFLTGGTDVVAASLAGVYSSHKGYMLNLYNGSELNNLDEIGVRTKIAINLGSDWKLVLAGNFLRRYDYANGGYNFLNTNALPLSLGYHISTDPYYTYNNDYESAHELVEDRGLSATLKGEIGSLSFASISSYSNSGVRSGLDNDASDAPLGAIFSSQFIESVTQEFQLLSSDKGPLRWIAGAYLYDANAGSSPDVLITSEVPAPNVEIEGRIRTVSVSAYGQLTYDFSPAFGLTVGARENRDSKTLLLQNTLIPAIGFATTAPRENHTWDNFSPKGTLQYHPNDASLIYASYTKGFKAGNFNLFSPGLVNPETLNAYEVGGKHKLADNRFAIDWAAFYYKYKNLQVDTIIPAGSGVGGTILETLNAASSKTYGADVTAEAAATEQLRLTAGVSYLHAIYESYPNAAVYVPVPGDDHLGNALVSENVSGNDVPYAPHWSATTTARYTIPLGSHALDLFGSYGFTDSYSIEPTGRLRQPSYSMVAGNITFHITDKISIYGYGKNLLDKMIVSGSIIAAVGDKVSYGAPRIVGVGFRAGF